MFVSVLFFVIFMNFEEFVTSQTFSQTFRDFQIFQRCSKISIHFHRVHMISLIFLTFIIFIDFGAWLLKAVRNDMLLIKSFARFQAGSCLPVTSIVFYRFVQIFKDFHKFGHGSLER